MAMHSVKKDFTNNFIKKSNRSSGFLLNTDYLINRAEATLGSIHKVKKGHADYLSNMAGELLQFLSQFDLVTLSGFLMPVNDFFLYDLVTRCWRAAESSDPVLPLDRGHNC